jgi:hypothetical protein
LCALRVCARCLLRVEDRAVDWKFGSFKRARAEDHKSSFVLRKASGFPPLHFLFWTYNTACLNNIYYFCCNALIWWANTFLRTWLDVSFYYLDQPCSSNAWVDNCLACSNLGWFYVGYDNATQFCVGYVNVTTRSSMV